MAEMAEIRKKANQEWMAAQAEREGLEQAERDAWQAEQKRLKAEAAEGEIEK